MGENKKVLLIIMDGWGHGEANSFNNAIFAAKTPFIDSLYDSCPNTELVTHGASVGLPPDQMGNSEVGHMNIGAGRVVFQELMRVNNSIVDGNFESNRILNEAIAYAKNNKKPLHLMGLVSDGGVHAHIDHLKATITHANKKGLDHIFIHAFTDGRDTDPKSGIGFIRDIDKHLVRTNAKIATICGRYYAMDRDKRWARTREAYNMLRFGQGEKARDPVQGIQKSYDKGITDEFIKPLIITDANDNPTATINEGDVLICFNFRTDRCRQLIRVLTQEDFPAFGMNKLNIACYTFTRYDNMFENVSVIFENEIVQKTIGEVIASKGLTQLRIAETEKYAHVTYFFSGGREELFPGEMRIMIPSPKVATYDLQPEMSANEVKDKMLALLAESNPNFICLNFANADMVGHTGIFEAAVKAVETVDRNVQIIAEKALQLGYDILITADHGNADFIVNADGSPNTAHTKNKVPLFFLSNKSKSNIQPGKLGNLAPTILKLLGIDPPTEMSCKSLLNANVD